MNAPIAEDVASEGTDDHGRAVRIFATLALANFFYLHDAGLRGLGQQLMFVPFMA